MMKQEAIGLVKKVFGNLLHVEYQGNIQQGEVVMIQLNKGHPLKAEVIEIIGNAAKIQVFEDTRDISFGCPVKFSSHLLEAELGPGLLTSIFDGLQNPLEKVADAAGFFLNRGVYLPPLDKNCRWNFQPTVNIGDRVHRGDSLGFTMEGRFHHQIMVPFVYFDHYTIEWVIQPGAYTIDTVVARGVDDQGKELSFTMSQKWPIKVPLFEGEKIKPSQMMSTGLRILDTQFPVLKGGTFCSPGPFGAGKTVMQHHLSKYSSVDIVVIVACGERAGEVVELLRTFPYMTDFHTNESLMSRTVIICNTSSMPVAAREASIYTGATIAEYYRQMGLNVLLLADSTSRWAQAMREMSGRLEEIPGEEAFPAYLASRIVAFYERSGVVALSQDRTGTLTIGGTVSPAGGNFEEPVTQATLTAVGAFHGLSRERSDARRYPAIDPLISWSKYIEKVSVEFQKIVPGWGNMVKRAARFLRDGDEIGKRMEVVGEEGVSMDDMLIFLKSELYEFCYLQQNAFDKEDAYCPLDRQIPLFILIDKIFNTPFYFSSHDDARSFFLDFQNELKNMNFMPFESDRYRQAFDRIEKKIQTAQEHKGTVQ
ncbi:V-type sodium ATPase catalytic subunit A [Candidatus Rhabdochlamydia oedothoracis]|uniref:V-type ATP synthase alpha chain n=2 Tax=Candidatus Rhabdochlamydiaceae TaxID=689704 RepID=A0ABX8V0J3_9BACT|nr:MULTISPECIES: V-type ATP synthase subunit A [Rhabdochlamydia]KAG6559242.1 V-type sodium ATPase catalytic subunit A [Candidatus Rhabdochlamydia sp. W815]MCL6755710.1 V-type ATP synthase subunit A [Candidatus Rhabdochlamydia oedothoracis]QYF48641.1 V-type sodium ATPase catalytic subunit A [Candidatus Rhabdochlamydia oedothoracis]